MSDRDAIASATMQVDRHQHAPCPRCGSSNVTRDDEYTRCDACSLQLPHDIWTDHMDTDTSHTGWDRGDYDLDEIGAFSGVESGEVDWQAYLDTLRQQLADFGPPEDRDPHEQQRAKELKRRERIVESHVGGGE